MHVQTFADVSPQLKARPTARPQGSLSQREHQVMQLVASGHTNAQIVQRLDISENTVKVHLRHIFEKLSVGSRTEAALRAVLEGWINLVEVVQAQKYRLI